jgi:hypothetical protein
MNAAKVHLLEKYCPDLIGSPNIAAGYHRGRRPFLGTIYYPDIVSVHHLHLHVIVQPHLLKRLFKYPPWLPLLWKSDTAVMRQAKGKDYVTGDDCSATQALSSDK